MKKRLHLLIVLVASFTGNCNADQDATLLHDAKIHVGGEVLRMNFGDHVSVISMSGNTAVIMVHLSDGSLGTTQINANLLKLTPVTSFSPESRGEIFVSPTGLDSNPGTEQLPVASPAQAQKIARLLPKGESVEVVFAAGVYRLQSALVFTPADSGSESARVTYEAKPGDTVVFSGGASLGKLNWQLYKGKILQAKVPDNLLMDQLFADGEIQRMARYPNYDPNVLIYNGYAADAISPARVAGWADPAGGFIHAQHGAQWGGFSWIIKGKKPDGSLDYEGGWQNNRSSSMHPQYRFVENIFEELDAPCEWYLNSKTHILYYYPPPSVDINTAQLEYARLKDLVEFQGSDENPVKFVTLRGIIFRHALRTFMDTREPLLRTDWAIYRGGAIFFNGSEKCGLEDCFIDQVGGNGVFVNNYNRHTIIRRCHIFKTGAGGINFIGDQKAARSPLFNYDQRQNVDKVDRMRGPLGDNYPEDCLVEDCLIHETGQIEKQSAPVDIDLSHRITIRHCSIYNCPRAGINIGDGCWGGHVIEFCDIFDTVRETGDHGSFNGWGRDRWWCLGGVNLDTDIEMKMPDLPKWDAMDPTYLLNNRWRCDHGWDIDLDDGCTNYVIKNNLCLNGGIKNREGFYRVVENNITVLNGFHPHCWFKDSGDVVLHNIFWSGYRPAGMGAPPWGKNMDYNFYQKPADSGPAIDFQKASGRDEHSIVGDANFIDPAKGNYQVQPDSPVFALGFKNFPMDQFGVQDPKLKQLALTPALPDPTGHAQHQERETTTKNWCGIQVRNIRDEGEMSEFGTPGVTGEVVLEVNPDSALGKAGVQVNDVILEVNDRSVPSTADLLNQENVLIAGAPFKVRVLRSQALMNIISK